MNIAANDLETIQLVTLMTLYHKNEKMIHAFSTSPKHMRAAQGLIKLGLAVQSPSGQVLTEAGVALASKIVADAKSIDQQGE